MFELEKISASSLDKFLFCPLAWKYIYIDKSVVRTTNLYIIYGSAIHKALEENYKQKIVSRVDLKLSECKHFFEMELLKLQAEAGIPRDYDLERLLIAQGGDMLELYLREVAPKIMPAFVEHHFEIPIPSAGLVINGYIDLITEDGIVIDHKTCGSSTEKKWTQSYVDRMVQLTMYSLAYRKTFNKPEKFVEIDVLKRLKSGPKFEAIKSSRTDMEVIALVFLIKKAKAIIEADMMYPNLTSCSECDFKDSCPRFY